MKSMFRILTVLMAFASGLSAQNLSTMTRGTAVAGINDSAVVMACDSVRPTCRTRAVTTHELFKRPSGTAAKPSYSFALDSALGMFRFGKDTLGFSTLSGQTTLRLRQGEWLGPDNQSLTIRAGSGANRSLTLQTVTSGSVVKNTLILGADSSATFLGTVRARSSANNGDSPVFTFQDDQNTGISTFGADQLSLVAGGAGRLLVGTNTLRVQGAIPFEAAPGTAAAPGITFNGDANTGLYRFGADTLGFATGGTGRMLLQSTGLHPVTDNSVALGTSSFRWSDVRAAAATIGALTISSCTGCTASFPLQGPNGSSSSGQVTYSFTNVPNSGMYVIPGDTLAFASDGFPALKLDYSSGTRLIGGAGNMNILAGTGASRTMTLQTTNGSGTAQSTLVLDASGNMTMLGPSIYSASGPVNIYSNGNTSTPGIQISSAGNGFVRVPNGSVTVPALGWSGGSSSGWYLGSNADTVGMMLNGTVQLRWVAGMPATGVGDVNLCWNSTSKAVRQGATCGSSSSKVKENIFSLQGDLALALRPVAFTYRQGFNNQRQEFGLIAEEAAKVDPRFAFFSERDENLPDGSIIKKGEAYNVNDRAVLAALIATVQAQEKRINELTAKVDSLSRRAP